MKFIAHQYQLDAARFHLAHPYSALFADPGTGKTAIMLMLISALKSRGELHGPILVCAPLRIATSVWPDEIAKWDQFQSLSYAVLHGKRKAVFAEAETDIHLINNEGLLWAASEDLLSRYHTLIIDESSKFKNWSAQRTKLLRKIVKQFSRRHILTGSPTPKSMMDLFPQMFLADAGASLGQYKTHFRNHYFVDKGWGTYPDWQLRDGAAEMIYDRIAPRCYRLDASEVLSLPPMIVNDIVLDLPKSIQKMSLEALREAGLRINLSAGGAYQMARRIAGGCLDGGRLHDVKIKALRDLIDELQGKPVLVAFYYKNEGDMLSEEFGFPRIDGRTSASKSAELIDAWNNRDLPGLCVQPAAGGHGLNLQRGGNDIVWYALTDNQDDYYQFNRRIWRQGVTDKVRVHRLLARGTADIAIAKSLESKTNQQAALLAAIRELTR